MNFIEKKLTEFEKKFKHTILSDTVMYKQIEAFLATAIQEAQAEAIEDVLCTVDGARGAIKSIHGSIENGYGMNKKALKKDLSYQESYLTNQINFWKKRLSELSQQKDV